ncbi:hypothetical protein STEG23_037026 [Scotinomys teguina]
MWSILEKVPWVLRRSRKMGTVFVSILLTCVFLLVGKIFFNDFVKYVFCAFELVFFSFFYSYYSKLGFQVLGEGAPAVGPEQFQLFCPRPSCKSCGKPNNLEVLHVEHLLRQKNLAHRLKLYENTSLTSVCTMNFVGIVIGNGHCQWVEVNL